MNKSRQIGSLVAEGKSNAEIAEAVDCAVEYVRTVKQRYGLCYTYSSYRSKQLVEKITNLQAEITEAQLELAALGQKNNVEVVKKSVSPKRGRPFGTGINDLVVVDAIKSALAENPDLNPTAAARSFGIENPSSIRRLREKLKNGTNSSAR